MKNVLVVCIDCLRFDKLGLLLHASPLLQSLVSAHGTVFTRAYTTAPWTHPATNSILTGLYPHKHRACHAGKYRKNVITPWPGSLAPEAPTIFSELGKAGFFTVGISTIYWALSPINEYSGCDCIIRSEEQEVFYRNTPAEWVVQRFKYVVGLLPERKNFCAYLHLIDLHRPYNLENALNHASRPVEIMEGLEEWDSRPYANDPSRLSRFRASKVLLYDGLIKYTGIWIGKLLEFMAMRKLLDKTTIIITADHGEEFWDHESAETGCDLGLRSQNPWLLGTGHGHTMFEEILHIPLLLIDTSHPAGSSPAPVSLVDIYPTVVQNNGHGSPLPGDGISLREATEDRELFAESPLYGYERKAMLRYPMKYVYSPFEDRAWTCDLSKDPDETRCDAGNLPADVIQELEGMFLAEGRAHNRN